MADVAQELAAFARAAQPDAHVMDVMRLSFLDWAAVGIAGKDEPVARILRDQALEEGGAPQASLIGCDTRVPARMAALVNGTTSHALDYDDTHFAHVGHPSVAVIPAALAVTQLTGATGQALQQAALIGAEGSIRMGVWLGRAHYQAGFHQTATAGAFGATLAAGRILQLSQDQLEMALGLVSTRASGLKSQFGTMGKPYNAGLAAANGVEAALLAARGFVSPPTAIEGPQGFADTHKGGCHRKGLEGLGSTWLFGTVQHKFHACCHGLHATLEALSGATMDPALVAEVRVATHPRWLRVCNIAAPTTGLEAKFSYTMVVAMSLLGFDTARLDSFRDELCRDPAIAALRRKVNVAGDETLGEMQARIDIVGTDGQTQSLFHDLDADPGLDVRYRKVRAKAQSLIGAERTASLWQVIQCAASPDQFTRLLT